MVGCETVKCRQRASKGPRVALESTCFPSPTGACMGWSLFFLKLGSSWPVKFGLRPEVLATAVARVNIKPTTAFCTISQEISQWISTATGNNGSQLQQPVVTLDIPVASGPMLSVEMRKSLTLCYRSAWGQSSWATTSNDLSTQLPQPLVQVASGWAHCLLVLWKGHIGRLAGRPMKSLGTQRTWCKGTHSWFTQSSSHLLKENLGVFFQRWGISGQMIWMQWNVSLLPHLPRNLSKPLVRVLKLQPLRCHSLGLKLWTTEFIGQNGTASRKMW